MNYMVCEMTVRGIEPRPSDPKVSRLASDHRTTVLHNLICKSILLREIDLFLDYR